MATVADFVGFLKQFAPLELAAEWDNVGLLLGDTAAKVERVMTCLTVTPESAGEAVRDGAQLIVSHHPILFRPTKKLTTANAEGRMILELAKAGIAVYSPHTAFDNCVGGINDILAKRLGLLDTAPLRRGDDAKQCKIVVFVPDQDLAKVSDAMFAAGAGHIGQYRECSFRLPGAGTFFGGESSNPTIGEKGRREDVSEWRLETICPLNRVESVVAALRCAHSYEEPAFDVYALHPLRARAGQGRVGRLPKPIPLQTLARKVKTVLKADSVNMVGEATQMVQHVALACGAAGEYLDDALHAQADVFLTGEMRFHDCLTARSRRIGVLLPGHHATERCGVEELASLLQAQFPSVKTWASAAESDPLRGV